jgi:hypothetical protein
MFGKNINGKPHKLTINENKFWVTIEKTNPIINNVKKNALNKLSCFFDILSIKI